MPASGEKHGQFRPCRGASLAPRRPTISFALHPSPPEEPMRTSIGPALTRLSLAFASAACNQPRTSAMARDTSMARDTAAAAAPKVDKNAEEQAIRDIGRRWEKMFADRDTSGMAALFADDGYEMPPNTKAMKGPEEVRKGTGAMLRTTKDFKLTFD